MEADISRWQVFAMWRQCMAMARREFTGRVSGERDVALHFSLLKIMDIWLINHIQNRAHLIHPTQRYWVINLFTMIYDHTKSIGSVWDRYYCSDRLLRIAAEHPNYLDLAVTYEPPFLDPWLCVINFITHFDIYNTFFDLYSTLL